MLSYALQLHERENKQAVLYAGTYHVHIHGSRMETTIKPII